MIFAVRSSQEVAEIVNVSEQPISPTQSRNSPVWVKPLKSISKTAEPVMLPTPMLSVGRLVASPVKSVWLVESMILKRSWSS